MSHVKVFCRFRPQNTLEIQEGGKVCITIDDTSKAVQLPGKRGQRTFAFDRIFNEKAKQEEVYNVVAKDLVESCIKGYNCSCFAYGQTGAGKTFTMMGTKSQRGIIPRLAHDIFYHIEDMQKDDKHRFTVKISFVEIYLERIRDLLATGKGSTNLKLREDQKRGRGVYIEGVREIEVKSEVSVLAVIAQGESLRTTATTKMNDTSSRSHSVFGITIVHEDVSSGTVRTGRMFVIDLAGSEMVKKTEAEGMLLKEAQKINLSLSALGNVINALTEGRAHIPYRDSKLTRLLQDSLGGTCKTSLIVATSPSSYNRVETLSTLRFGIRAKQIKNAPIMNKVYSIEEYKRMLRALRRRSIEQEAVISRLKTQRQSQQVHISKLQEELNIYRWGHEAAGAASMSEHKTEEGDETDLQYSGWLKLSFGSSELVKQRRFCQLIRSSKRLMILRDTQHEAAAEIGAGKDGPFIPDYVQVTSTSRVLSGAHGFRLLTPLSILHCETEDPSAWGQQLTLAIFELRRKEEDLRERKAQDTRTDQLHATELKPFLQQRLFDLHRQHRSRSYSQLDTSLCAWHTNMLAQADSFKGDYLRLASAHAAIVAKQLAKKGGLPYEQILFSSSVSRVHPEVSRRTTKRWSFEGVLSDLGFKKTPRGHVRKFLVITSRALYELEPGSKGGLHKMKVSFRVDVRRLRAINICKQLPDVMTISPLGHSDRLFVCSRRNELICWLIFAMHYARRRLSASVAIVNADDKPAQSPMQVQEPRCLSCVDLPMRLRMHDGEVLETFFDDTRGVVGLKHTHNLPTFVLG